MATESFDGSANAAGRSSRGTDGSPGGVDGRHEPTTLAWNPASAADAASTLRGLAAGRDIDYVVVAFSAPVRPPRTEPVVFPPPEAERVSKLVAAVIGTGGANVRQPGLAALSSREIEVLRSIALGFTSAEIAERLFLSVRTVEAHRARLSRKTGRRTRAELVQLALHHDLLRS